MLIKAITSQLLSNRIKGWFRIGLTFLTGQGILQLLQLISGLLVVRWMPVEQYAQYTFALGLQGVALNLVNSGVAGTIIGLVGKDVNNRSKIGNYIKTANFFRIRLFFIVGIIFTIVFLFITKKFDWTIVEKLGLLSSIILTLVFSGLIMFYKPVLQIKKEFKEIYYTEVAQAGSRLILILLLFVSIGLIAWQLALLSSVVLLFRGLSLRKKAKEFIIEPDKSSPETRKEMLSLIKPILPGVLFAAFQAQITIMIVSIFGSMQAIAEVGALGKLSQLFMLFNTSFSMLLVPYFARQDENGLLKKYVIISFFIATCLGLLVLVSSLFPQAFLLLLGKNYSGLVEEVFLIILTASVYTMNAALWGMNKSRKWVFNWMPMISIPGTILIQIACVSFFDMSLTYNVILLSLFTACFGLLNRLAVAIYGFSLGRINPLNKS